MFDFYDIVHFSSIFYCEHSLFPRVKITKSSRLHDGVYRFRQFVSPGVLHVCASRHIQQLTRIVSQRLFAGSIHKFQLLPSFRCRVPLHPVLIDPGIRSVVGKAAFNMVHISAVRQFICRCRVTAKIHKLYHIRSRISIFTI